MKSKMVVAALCLSLVSGCTSEQYHNVAQEIVNWAPTLKSAVAAVYAVVSTLDESSASIVKPYVMALSALTPKFEAAANHYLASDPSAVDLKTMQDLIIEMQQQTNEAMLAAAKITNPQTQAEVLKNFNVIATATVALLSLIQSLSKGHHMAALPSQTSIKLAQVRPYMDERAMQAMADKITSDLHVRPITVNEVFAREARAGF